MALSYLLAPIPKWYFADAAGKPLAGGKMYTYSNINPQNQKFVYQDPNGTLPYSDPIIFAANGEAGPFYWTVNSLDANDTYYIEVYDSNNVLQFTVSNFSPPGSGGGGGGGTTYITLKNYIINGQFWRNLGTSVTPLPTFLTICPGAHENFTYNPNVNPVIGLGSTAPDICFVKNNTNAVDQIIFGKFTLGSNVLTADITPQYYLQYTCGNNPASESYKYIQFPICSQVQNFSGQNMSIKFWAIDNSGLSHQLTLYWRQFYGDGTTGAADQRTPIQTFTLTNSWASYTVNTVVPDATGKSLGECGNDGLFLQFEYQLGAVANVSFTKPALYGGNNTPPEEFEVIDQVVPQINDFRTGDVRLALNNFTPFGWVPMNDGTIGSASSGGTTRANIDTFPLFDLIWNSVLNATAAGPTWAPIYDSSGNSVTKGSTSIADFVANRRLSLTKVLGRVLAGAINTPISLSFTGSATTSLLTVSSTSQFFTGVPVILSGGSLPGGLSANTTYYVINISSTTLKLATTPENAMAGTPITITVDGSGNIQLPANILGSFSGELTHAQTLAELVNHGHTGSVATALGGGGSGGLAHLSTPDGSFGVTVNPTGGGQPFNIMQPTSFMNIFIKL